MPVSIIFKRSYPVHCFAVFIGNCYLKVNCRRRRYIGFCLFKAQTGTGGHIQIQRKIKQFIAICIPFFFVDNFYGLAYVNVTCCCRFCVPCRIQMEYIILHVSQDIILVYLIFFQQPLMSVIKVPVEGLLCCCIPLPIEQIPRIIRCCICIWSFILRNTYQIIQGQIVLRFIDRAVVVNLFISIFPVILHCKTQIKVYIEYGFCVVYIFYYNCIICRICITKYVHTTRCNLHIFEII